MNKGSSPDSETRLDTNPAAAAASEGRLVALARERAADMAEKDDGSEAGEPGKFGPSMMALPEDFEPGEYDVICGRGKTVWKHIGNKNFRAYVATQTSVYEEATTKLDKSNILSAVVAAVRRRSPKGGFVKKDTVTGRWYEVGDFLAREKTSQAFRDVLHDSYRSSNKTKRKRRVEEQAKVAAQNYKMQRMAFQRLNSGFVTQPNMFQMLSQQTFLNNNQVQVQRPELREDFTSNTFAGMPLNQAQALISFGANNQSVSQGATAQGLRQAQVAQHPGASLSNALAYQDQGLSMSSFASGAGNQTTQASLGQQSLGQQQHAGFVAQLNNLSRGGMSSQQQQQLLLMQQEQEHQQLMLHQQQLQQQMGQQLVSGQSVAQGTSSQGYLQEQGDMPPHQIPGQTQQLNSYLMQQGQSRILSENQALRQLNMPSHAAASRSQYQGMPGNGGFASGSLDSFAQNLAAAVQQSPQDLSSSNHGESQYNPFEPTPLDDDNNSGAKFDW